jgi:hypothetical protein
LDQLIEKIIAVSQSEEQNQSEYFQEFERGRQLVEEITGLLTNISSLPPSSIFDPIIHLIEQRLQSQEIVDLTNFNKVMEAIVSEGIAGTSVQSDIEIQAIPALATIDNTIANSLEKVSPLQLNEKTIEVNNFPVIISDEKVDITSLIPKEAARLALILRQIYPDSQVQWNFSLGEYNFLVQVEDLLIYMEIINEGENIEKEMKKQGWSILVCKKEDLAFPRRFERAIYRITNKSKYHKK